MNTNRILSMKRTISVGQRKHLAGLIALGLTCTLLPSVAFAQNTSTDPDPDVEAGSYIALNVDQDIVATGDPITGTATIYEGDGDIDSDDSIEAVTDLGYTETGNGLVTFKIPTDKYGDIILTSSSADAARVQKIIHSVSVNTKTTPSDDFSGRSQTTYGVGEVVGLSFTTSPSGYESRIGTPSWSGQTQAGTGLITQTGADGTFTAGDIADSVSIILSITDGPLKGKSYSKDRSVIPPSGVTYVRTGSIIHQKGIAQAGFNAYTYFAPTYVSFSNVSEEEEYTLAEEQAGKSGPVGVGIGSLSFKDGSVHHGGGYFQGGAGNISTGCLFGIDTVTATNGNKPFATAGNFTWNIPRDYKVAGHNTVHSAYTSFVHHNQQSKTDKFANSITTISKGGITVSANQNDPTSP